MNKRGANRDDVIIILAALAVYAPVAHVVAGGNVLVECIMWLLALLLVVVAR